MIARAQRVAAPLAVALAVALARAPAASAEVSLVLTHEPGPRTLKMRRKRAAAAPDPAPARPRPKMPKAPRVSATAPEPIEGLEGLRDVRQPVSFSIDIGYQVDGARPTGRPGLGQPAPVPGRDYATLRSYGFGEAFLSTRGVGLASLDTYFAMRFQAARSITTANPVAGMAPVAVPSPIATWFERSGYEFRTGWAEMRDFLPDRFGLRPLRVRAGSQYVYGPWMLHLDGLYVAYDGALLTASLYSGVRHSDYTRAQSERRPVVAGASLRLDLSALASAVPVAVGGEYMTLSASDETGEGRVDTTLGQIDWRPRRDIVVLGQIRGVNGDLASQRVEVRTRFKQVTNIVFDITRRFEADWRWDPSLVSPRTAVIGTIDTEARRYLDLGPVLPQLIASARAGTLIRENIDLLARAAIASDLDSGDAPVNTYSAPYVELAGGLEVRLRRQVALDLSALTRQHTERETPPAGQQIVDIPGTIDPLPDQPQLGEQGFTELGTAIKMTLGARRFSAMVEVYGRRTRYTVNYRDALDPLPPTELHGGGRFTVDAWVGRKLRLFASYDVSSVFDSAPEISGYKSLRLMMTGIY